MQFIDLSSQQEKIKESLQKRIQDVLSHGKYIMGPEVYEIEQKLADYVGVKNCISCASGTDALLISLMALGIGPNDAVITTPFTYIATAEVLALLGATPVFVDIYKATYNINPDLIGNAVKSAKDMGLNPKAIIPVDLFGLPARYRLIEVEARKHNLFIISDSAQGFGGSIRRRKAGSYGDIAITSFFPAKPLGCYGDGGAIFTNNDNFANIMKSIRVHGSGVDKYENIRVGINGRLDTIQAAILIEKLAIFPDELKSRNKIANYYKSNIKENLQIPFVPKDYVSSWAQFSLLAKSKTHRSEIMNILKVKNVPSVIYYRIPLHLQPVFSYLNYKEGDFPISEEVSKNIFSIPMHPYLTEKEQDYIMDALGNE